MSVLGATYEETSEAEDRLLAEFGISDWLDALDDEDRHSRVESCIEPS